MRFVFRTSARSELPQRNLTITMVTYLHAFRRVVLAPAEGEDVRLVRRGVGAVFF
jgi:hypothetical protein